MQVEDRPCEALRDPDFVFDRYTCDPRCLSSVNILEASWQRLEETKRTL